jgi:hypothetical protein
MADIPDRLKRADERLESLMYSEDENVALKAIDLINKKEGGYKDAELDTRPIIQVVNFVFPERRVIEDKVDAESVEFKPVEIANDSNTP